MITEDQSEVVAFLGDPSTHGGSAVERIETHASVVFLAGARAWKLKRAVRYDYLDFSTESRRRRMCEAEVRLNRRTAPSLYRGVSAVVRTRNGALALGGEGTPVDWVVQMSRFDQEALLDRMASRGALDAELMPALAAALVQMHKTAEPRADQGGREGLAWVIAGNASGFVEEGRGILDREAGANLTRAADAALERHAALLDRRRAGGRVRECHGDLHLRNIVLLDGRPTPFDAVEFNDRISCTDVLYDLAFLLMDLWRRNLRRHANAVLNAYLPAADDFEGLVLMPLFLSCRAAVRAKTSATAARLQQDTVRRQELEALARSYLVLAGDLLAPPAPCVVAIGGFSGTGKSTLARALAPETGGAPGAVIVRSDEIRKRLTGVEPLTRLGPQGYAEEVTRRVYAAMCEDASTVSRCGHAVVADAVFATPADREAIRRTAAAASVPFVGLWLEAPEAVLAQRLLGREADVSDADGQVLRSQLARGAGDVRWIRIPAGADQATVARRATEAIESTLGRRAG